LCRFAFFTRLPFFLVAIVLSSVEQVIPVLMLVHSFNTNTQRVRIKCKSAISSAQNAPTRRRFPPSVRRGLHRRGRYLQMFASLEENVAAVIVDRVGLPPAE
jgi:hypothetical protein